MPSGRPKPQVIASTQETAFHRVDILAASHSYQVRYQGQHINIKDTYWNSDGEFNKYRKNTFPNRAPAEILARKLNDMFFTQDFAVAEIT